MTQPYPDDVQAEVAAANREHREVELTDEQLAELGHGKRSLTKVIRLFCLACQGDNAAEVRRCTSPGCALYPYRMGKNPFTGRKGRPGFAEPSAREPFQPERGENGAGSVEVGRLTGGTAKKARQLRGNGEGWGVLRTSPRAAENKTRNSGILK